MRRPLAVATCLAAVVSACAHGPSRKDRQAAEIHHDLGVDAIRAGRASEALRELDQAVALHPAFAEAHRARGIVLEFGFGKLADAELEYRRALELKASYPEASNDLGQVLAKTGRWDEALARFDDALHDMMYREPWVARCNKGQALWRMGRRDEGLADLRACLASAPTYCAGRRELGRLLVEAGKLKEAIDELSAYARTCEKVPDAHYQLGLARMKEGNLPLAREAFARCEELGAGTAVGEECHRSRELLQ
jgi:type IV pilus assembly protein PilF